MEVFLVRAFYHLVHSTHSSRSNVFMNRLDSLDRLINFLNAGGCFDRLLCAIEKRKCFLAGHQQLGVRLEKDSYSGVLGEFQSRRADIYIRGQTVSLSPG